MSIFGFTAKRIAGMVAAKIGSDHLLTRDESGQTRIARWAGSESTLSGLNAVTGVQICTACKSRRLRHGAITCQEHNSLVIGMLTIAHQLAIPAAYVKYTRSENQRGYDQMRNEVMDVINGANLYDMESCPSIRTNYQLPHELNIIPTHVSVVRNAAHNDLDVVDVMSAFDDRVIKRIELRQAAPILSSSDQRLG